MLSAWPPGVQPPLFPSDCEFAQLLTIFQILGTPREDIWPGVTELKDWCAICPPPLACMLSATRT